MSPHRIAMVLLTALAAAVSPELDSDDATAQALPTARISAGQQVGPQAHQHRWGFVVALLYRGWQPEFQSFFCGGSLIDARHVLTAAHCVTDGPGLLVPAEGIEVSHSRVLSTTGRPAPRRYGVQDVFVHPLHRTSRFGDEWMDVAVIRLASSVANPSVVPLAARGEENAWLPGGVGRIAGWGITDPNNPLSDSPVLREAGNVVVQPQARCSGPAGPGTAYRPEVTFCAGDVRGTQLERDTCPGDSGGPFVVTYSGLPRLVGVTSYAQPPCGHFRYGGYARVDAGRDWIDRVMVAGPAGTGPGGSARPQGLAVIGRDYGSVTISWSPGNTTDHQFGIWIRGANNGIVTDRVVTTTAGGSYTVPLAPRRSGSSAITVRPIEADGTRGPHARISAAPLFDLVAPQSPLWVSARLSGRRTFFVRWGYGADYESGLGGVLLQYRLAGTARWGTLVERGFPNRALGPLRPNATYQFRVASFDLAGNIGRFSPIHTARTR